MNSFNSIHFLVQNIYNSNIEATSVITPVYPKAGSTWQSPTRTGTSFSSSFMKATALNIVLVNSLDISSLNSY